MYNHVIYHKNCLDGFSSVVILSYLKIIPQNCFIFGDVPSNEKLPINIDNKNIIIVDVAYNTNMIKRICKKAKKVLYIDHHVTHEKDIHKLNLTNLEKVIKINSFSACYLTWQYFSKDKVPKYIKYISDNDTGTWKYKYTNNLITTLSVDYKIDISKIEDWFPLFNDLNLKKLIKRGKEYMKYSNYLLEKSLSQHAIVKFPTKQLLKKYPKIANIPLEYTVAIHNGACPTTTMVGNYLLKNIECDFVIIYSYHLEKHRYTISFRSKTVDVESIAKILGGGGHKYAASCQINSFEFRLEDLFEVIQ